MQCRRSLIATIVLAIPVLAIPVLTMLLAPPAASAQGQPDVTGPVVGQAILHDTSPALRDIVPEAAPITGLNVEVNPIEPPHRTSRPTGGGKPDDQRQIDDRPFAAAALTPLPTINVPGLSDDDNAVVAGTRIVPPDTQGDIGPNHYVQWINLIIAVWDVSRDGSGNPTAATLDAGFGIRAGNSIWAGFGGVCQTTNDGDPIVIYDHLADRWMLSQFAINSGVQCVAMSTGPDPTGSYFRWAFPVSPGEQNDYPKFGLMPDAYYLSLRDFPSNDGTFASAVAFDRAALLAGAANPTFIKFSLPCLNNNCPDGIQPPHLEGPAPPAGTTGIFSKAWDDDFDGPLTGGVDGYRLWEFVPNFASPASSTFTELPIVPSGVDFDNNMCGFFNRNCIPQASSAQLLDPVDELQMYRAQYRHFAGSHDSLLISTTVDATGTDVAGVRWAELRNTGAGWTRFQDGTYAPADGLERWMSSIAMDDEGNIALGYSASSSSVDPSVRYTTREAADPLGTFPGGEVILQAGLGAQTGANRWGDYSSMSVDPVAGCTFWYTQEYYENTNSFDFKTRIGAFQIANCGGGPECTINQDCDDGLFCNGAEVCNAGTCEAGPPVNCDDGVSCTVDACNETTNSCDNTPSNALCDDGLFCNGAETCDPVLDCQAGTDPCAPLACDENGDVCIGGATAQLESGSVTVGAAPVTVNLVNTYTSPVVVTTMQYSNSTSPTVTRVSSVTSTSFAVRLQNPSGGDVAVENVSYLVVEEGSWTIDGVTVEAQRYTSTVTDDAPTNWVGEAQAYTASFTNPVVIGQVMSLNDPGFSVFWDQGTARTNPPDATTLVTGKTVCEDTDVTRLDETVGFVVFEAGHGTIGDVEFEAALGADSVLGVGNAPPYTYTFNSAFASAPSIALTSLAGMDGNNGGWAQVHGATLATTTSLFLSVDEDIIGDAERNHTGEQVSYVAFGGPVVFPPVGGGNAVAEWGSVIAGSAAVTVNLTQTYTNPVVVTSVLYANNVSPVVTRVSSVTGSSFAVRLQNPSGAVVDTETIFYLVVEEGNHTVGGVNISASTYNSTVTDQNNSWVGQAQTYGQSFVSPVVLGQVMSDNDPSWSVFWDRGTARNNPPVATALTTGKTVCEDIDVTRADETVGIVVFEAAHATLGGVEFEAALGADTILGVDDAPPYTYTFGTPFGSLPRVALATMAGVDGGNGGWAYVLGASTTSLDLVIDEDQIGDAERNHTTEQVGYVVFAGAGSVSQ